MVYLIVTGQKQFMLKWSCKVWSMRKKRLQTGDILSRLIARKPVICTLGSPRQRLSEKLGRCLEETKWFFNWDRTCLSFSMKKLTDYFYFIYWRNPSSGRLLTWHRPFADHGIYMYQLLLLHGFQVKLLMAYMKAFRKRAWTGFRCKPFFSFFFLSGKQVVLKFLNYLGDTKWCFTCGI